MNLQGCLAAARSHEQRSTGRFMHSSQEEVMREPLPLKVLAGNSAAGNGKEKLGDNLKKVSQARYKCDNSVSNKLYPSIALPRGKRKCVNCTRYLYISPRRKD